MSIQQIQNALIEDVRNNLRYYVELKWADSVGSIHFYTKKDQILETALNLSMNYTNYYKKEYKIGQIIIKDIDNKNPHIKINKN